MKFNEFENILNKTIKEFEEINKIGYIGFMGSLNMEHDLDFIIMPEENIKKGEFLKVMCNFLELLNKNLKKESSRLITFMYSPLEEETEFLAKREKNKDIFLHINTFIDLVPPHPKVVDALLNSKKVHGNRESMKKIPETTMDFEYMVLVLTNCLYSQYPKELETKKTQHQVSYLLKHINKKIDLKNKTNKQIYFECCDIIDSIAKIK